MAGQGGSAQGGFDYRDGHVSGVVLARPTGLPLLDRAAVATVMAAHYPPPPDSMQHRDVHLTVVVRFDPDQPE